MSEDGSDSIGTALQQYQDGKIGMRSAADMAGLSIREIMTQANERGIVSNYDEAELAEDIDALR